MIKITPKSLLLMFLIVATIGCKKKQTEETIVHATLEKDCYAYSDKDNSVYFQITENIDGISGHLKYDLSESKSTNGTFKGLINGDTLSGVYTFVLDGKIDKREMVFLIADNQLLESYGDLIVEDGYTYYEDYNTLKLVETMPLSKVDCIDKEGCLTAFGYIASKVKDCIILTETISLSPLENGKEEERPAYLLFSDDDTKAEVFLPNKSESILLQREGSTADGTWANANFKLFTFKGYVLEKDGVPLFGSR